MPVITRDVLIEGYRRDDVFAWLSDPEHHDRFLSGGFDGCKRTGDRTWELTLRTPPRNRVLGYKFIAPDDSHGGRRILCQTTGKRTQGRLNFSLRTQKPSTNTLVTLHSDYATSGLLGGVVNRTLLGSALEAGWSTVLENLAREIMKG